MTRSSVQLWPTVVVLLWQLCIILQLAAPGKASPILKLQKAVKKAGSSRRTSRRRQMYGVF